MNRSIIGRNYSRSKQEVSDIFVCSSCGNLYTLVIDLFADVVVLKCPNCCHIKTYMGVEEAFYDLFGDKSREEF